MPHKGSQDTYDFIAKWAGVNPIFFSQNDKWYRMGPLGMFADIALSCLPVGYIVEIGCGESSIYLSHVARKYNRKIFHCDIACDKIVNPSTIPGYIYPEALNIRVEDRDKLLTYGKSNFLMGTSDSLFEKYLGGAALAFTFVDGDHCYAQAKKDFDNAMALTVDNGYVVLHDTYPPNENYLSPDSACGDVYKLRQEIEKDERYDSLTMTHGVAMDVGMTIVRKKPIVRPYFQE